MKILTNLLKFISILILTICLISVGIITIIFSTIFDKNYVEEKLEETNFYEETYKLVESNFENYIYQSGLDEEVLENICTKEKVKQDINIMLSNIYNGTKQNIDTTEIANNLDSNIDKLGIKNKQNESAIQQFVEHICNEYTDTIIHTKYENKINDMYTKITEKLNKIYEIVSIILVIDFIIIVVINNKKISKDFQYIGLALLATSFFELISMQIIISKVNINGIKILNDVFSKTVVTIIQDIISQVNSLALGSIIIGALVSSIYSARVISKKSGKTDDSNQENK